MPAAHGSHGPPSGPEYPALQVHDDTSVLPAGEVASSHAVHVVVAMEVVKYVFALHVHALKSVDACGEVLSTGQERHIALPSIALYVPDAHGAQIKS